MITNNPLPLVIYSEANIDYIIYGVTSSINSNNEVFTFYPITKITFHDASHTTVSNSGLTLETIKTYETNNNTTVNIKLDKTIILNLILNNCVFDD